MKITIRRAEPEDLDEILGMDRRIFPLDCPPADPDRHPWWLARVDEVVVGYCSAAPSRQWSDVIYLSRAGVVPAARGLRLQFRMIRVREAWGRSIGAAWSITDTSFDNVRSINTLIRAGYRAYLPAIPWAVSGSTFWRRALR